MSRTTLYTKDSSTLTGIREASFDEIVTAAREQMSRASRGPDGCAAMATLRNRALFCKASFTISRGCTDAPSIVPRKRSMHSMTLCLLSSCVAVPRFNRRKRPVNT
jgi:hypothetical protein